MQALFGAQWLGELIRMVAAASALEGLRAVDGFGDAGLGFLGVELANFALRNDWN